MLESESFNRESKSWETTRMTLKQQLISRILGRIRGGFDRYEHRNVVIYNTSAPNSDISALTALDFKEKQCLDGAKVNSAALHSTVTSKICTAAPESQKFECWSADHHNPTAPSCTFKHCSAQRFQHRGGAVDERQSHADSTNKRTGLTNRHVEST
ncbi:hypothetical protein M5K25_003575 [Dendrobium thyrsiflorum]|uniref:Uncharacterized protein n=1 Tax=Dendrobium thyrsiflorum TaxID=117978 RepID=A0ABD0VQY9_DENTH